MWKRGERQRKKEIGEEGERDRRRGCKREGRKIER